MADVDREASVRPGVLSPEGRARLRKIAEAAAAAGDPGAVAWLALLAALEASEERCRMLERVVRPFARVADVLDFYVEDACPDSVVYPHESVRMSEDGPERVVLSRDNFFAARATLDAPAAPASPPAARPPEGQGEGGEREWRVVCDLQRGKQTWPQISVADARWFIDFCGLRSGVVHIESRTVGPWREWREEESRGEG